MLLWAALSFLPDADVIGFGLGVRYEDPWGHRGATHSLMFALIVGVAAALVASLLRRPAFRTGVMATLVVASHALLDTLTDGGLGCALFWPFDLTRYFAPWRPLPVSPIGLGFLSPYGMYVGATELVVFAPVLWYALSSRNTDAHGVRSSGYVGALLVTVWLLTLWLLMSGDPLRERVVGLFLRDQTQFTPGFSEEKHRAITRGERSYEVRARVGAPFSEDMFFGDRPDMCVVVRVESDLVADAQPVDLCRARGVQRGVPRAEAMRTLGVPEAYCWVYSRNPSGGYYRARAVCFENDRVAEVIRRWVRN
jgi:inner membrane protein